MNYPQLVAHYLAEYCGLSTSSLRAYQSEPQNKAYEGAVFEINGRTVRYRTGKTTPKKLGHFVAFWQKNTEGQNQAYAFAEAPEYLVIGVEEALGRGCFVFPKAVLKAQGVYATAQQKGKLGMRVYAPWCELPSPQALNTQAWQALYFKTLSEKSLLKSKKESLRKN